MSNLLQTFRITISGPGLNLDFQVSNLDDLVMFQHVVQNLQRRVLQFQKLDLEDDMAKLKNMISQIEKLETLLKGDKPVKEEIIPEVPKKEREKTTFGVHASKLGPTDEEEEEEEVTYPKEEPLPLIEEEEEEPIIPNNTATVVSANPRLGSHDKVPKIEGGRSISEIPMGEMPSYIKIVTQTGQRKDKVLKKEVGGYVMVTKQIGKPDEFLVLKKGIPEMYNQIKQMIYSVKYFKGEAKVFETIKFKDL